MTTFTGTLSGGIETLSLLSQRSLKRWQKVDTEQPEFAHPLFDAANQCRVCKRGRKTRRYAMLAAIADTSMRALTGLTAEDAKGTCPCCRTPGVDTVTDPDFEFRARQFGNMR